jgi:predicted nucleic acid-binding protein
MKIICNSSTLIALQQIKRLDVLEKIFKTIIIPEEVAIEIAIKETNIPAFIQQKKINWLFHY